MLVELSQLRNQIDEIDKALLLLLTKRQKLVKAIGIVKKQQGLPIYMPEREKLMLKSLRIQAKKIGISPNFIEDIVRRIIRESYQHENN